MHRATAGERIARTYAWVVVALRAVLPLAWIAAAVVAWFALPALGGSGSAPLDDIVATDAQAIVAQQRALELFGATVGTDTAVVQRNPRGLTDAEQQAHLAAARDVPAQDGRGGIRGVVPVPNAPVPGVRWPEQSTTVVSFLLLGPELNLEERDRAARTYAQRLRPAEGSSVGVTGAGPARLEQFRSIEDALPLVTGATVLVILLIVTLYFRSVGAPLVTLLTAAVAYVIAVRGLGWASEAAGVTAPSEIEPVLVVLLLGLVTDYTIFFMAEGRRLLRRGEQRIPSARAAAARIGPIVITAGIVVGGGAASLLAGETQFFRVFGPGLAISALLVTLVCLTFVPALLGLLGPRLFGRATREASERGRGRDADAEPAALVADLPMTATPSRRRGRLQLRFAGLLGSVRASRRQARTEGGRVLPAVGARLLATKPVAFVIALACVVALGGAAYAGRDADLAVSYIPSLGEDTEVRRAADAATRGFGPGVLAPTDVIVEQPGITTRPRELALLQDAIAGQPGVATVLGPRQPNGTPLEELVLAKDGRAARFAVLLDSEPTGTKAMDDLERLQERLPALAREAGLPDGGLRISYAGETALAAESVDALATDMTRVALVTVLVVFVLLALFLQALVAPLLLVLGSVLAFAASFGLTTMLLPQALGGTDFVFFVPLVAGVLLIGLGSDYNVFIAGRIREEARRRRLREAIAVATPSASRAITVAGITLAATFALLALVDLRSFRELAMLMTIGVLVDALVVRPVLIPTLITLAGRAAWWPGRATRPPTSKAVVERVMARTGLDAREARQVTEATLATLGERIPNRQACEVAAHLPESLAAPLRATAGSGDPFDASEFVTRVARRADVPRDRARVEAEAVLATLVEALPETEVDYVRAALSEDYRPLMGDAVRVPAAEAPVAGPA